MSIITQIMETVNVMTRSIRIKEDNGQKMFTDKCNAVKDLAKNKESARKAAETLRSTKQMKKAPDNLLDSDNIMADNYKHEVDRLQIENTKLHDDLNKERNNNNGLYGKLLKADDCGI